MKGISLYSVVPVRAEARESAEQNTQMLFGETCTILEQKPRWNRIKLDNDGQEGWIDAKMLAPMTEEEYTSYSKAYASAAMVSFPMVFAVSENNQQKSSSRHARRRSVYPQSGCRRWRFQ